MALLSVCIPTCDRPDTVRRAVASVVASSGFPDPSAVEVVVTDNSQGTETAEAVRPLLERWRGPTQYVHNVPNIGMVGNFNRCVELASGRWVLILHDDDYLVPRGLARIVAGLRRAEAGDRAVLFGVRVVNERGRLLRLQTPLRRRSLTPEQALRRHLTRSSYVRFPAIAVHRDAYEHVGCFDDSVGPATDLDMWSRVFAAFGVRLEPRVVVAYVVHAEAATERMFSDEYVTTLIRIFDRAVDLGVLSETEVRRAQAHWFNQFVLAGTFRRLRARDRAAARDVLALLELEDVKRLGPSRRWLPARLLFSLVVAPRRQLQD